LLALNVFLHEQDITLACDGEGLAQDSSQAKAELHKKILETCKHISGQCKINAVCQSDAYTIEAPTAKSSVEVLLLLQNFSPRLMSYVRVVGNRNVVIFAVDKWIFERDVDSGFLGEALARLLIFPYTALDNESYLRNQEISLKKRLIVELLENIIVTYPELSYHMRIKPEYFMYEVVLNRVRVFPPMAYGASHFLCGEADGVKVDSVLSGYLEALNQLQSNGIVTFNDDYITLSEKFISASKNSKVRFSNIIKNAPRAVFTSIFGVFHTC
jgi:hypothetical protein